MTEIDYRHDPLAVPTDEDATGKPWLIDFSYYAFPVRLRVSGIDLLKADLRPLGDPELAKRLAMSHPSPDDWLWLRLPVVHLADAGLRAVVRARMDGRSELFLGESGRRLYMRRSASDIMLVSEFGGVTACAGFIELYHAFDEFAGRVRCLVRASAPALMCHPYWGRWLDGERFPPARLMQPLAV